MVDDGSNLMPNARMKLPSPDDPHHRFQIFSCCVSVGVSQRVHQSVCCGSSVHLFGRCGGGRDRKSCEEIKSFCSIAGLLFSLRGKIQHMFLIFNGYEMV